MKKKTVTRLLLTVEILIMIAACIFSADFISWLVNNTGSNGWYNLLDAVIVLAAAFILLVAMMILGIVILKFDKKAQEEDKRKYKHAKIDDGEKEKPQEKVEETAEAEKVE